MALFDEGTCSLTLPACANVSLVSGWNVTYETAGRFLVALPQNGVPGATFGRQTACCIR